MHVSLYCGLWQLTGKRPVATQLAIVLLLGLKNLQLALISILMACASLLDGPRGGDASDSVPLPLSFPSFDRILVMELAGSP